MALTPIPYTKNWDDVFGSQNAPEATAVKIADIVIAAPWSISGQIVTINRTHASAMQVDWGDGVIEAAPTGVRTHTYTRRGEYRVRSWITAYPDIYVDELIRVTTRPPATVTLAAGTTNQLVLTVHGAIYPLTIHWGDGQTRYEESDKGNMSHVYPAPGAYTLRVSNGEGAAQTFAVTIPVALEDPEEDPEAHWSEPYPWESFSTHALFNEFVEEHDLTVPPQWFQWALAAKRAYLATQYGDG